MQKMRGSLEAAGNYVARPEAPRLVLMLLGKGGTAGSCFPGEEMGGTLSGAVHKPQLRVEKVP